ncbi:MAG: zinc-ribbon domain-containing protein [Oscillospiraceae bacterium]|nr:zinc-ribbon domain-containing protein [Oscillospiraceae bacterium]MBR0450956.1 zinc-ribbon domain-containing protein [Oscillospiraceae bacterium]
MVTCGNCGAQYDENEKVCPYCGAENVPVSIKEQSDYLQGISRKKALLNTVIPQEKAKRAEKKVHRTALVLVAFFLLFALMAAGYSIVRTKQKRYNQQEALRILEEYYVNNDYEGMYEYYWGHDDLYSATYDKYEKLCDVYHYYSNGNRYLEEDLSYIKQYGDGAVDWTDNIGYDLSCFFRALWLLDELEDNGYIYNEKAGADYLKEMTLSVLKQTCLLSDNEIQEGLSRYEGFETDYSDLAEQVIRRVV